MTCTVENYREVSDWDAPSFEVLSEPGNEDELEYRMGRWKWRLNNLYTCVDKNARVIPFRPNWAQRDFLDNIHGMDIILKARQLGFSTLIEILILDACMWNKNIASGIITITLDDGVKLLKTKVRDVYERIPEPIKELSPLSTDSATLVEFENGSSITVGISLRGGTYQILHVSELGKIAARFPARAQEIKSGAFNTVGPDQHIFVESTAEGQEGLFFDICEDALARQRAGIDPIAGEFKLHFYPWFEEPAYTLDTNRTISKEMKTYFKALQKHTGRVFARGQVAWYQFKKAQQGNEMKREFPSTPEEAFEASVEGAIFREEIARVYDQQRIGSYPYDASLGAVYTFWDIGRNDYTVILLGQRVSAAHWNWFKVLYGQSKSMPHYVDLLIEEKLKRRINWGLHVLPHDGNNHEWLSMENRKTQLENALMSHVEICPRPADLYQDIELVRPFWETSTFDAEGCGDFLKMAQNYKWRRDERLGVWMPKPEHNDPSHFVDAYRTAASAHRLNIIDDSEYGPTFHQDNHFERSGAGGY